jgi:hypothetical protein
MALSSSCVHRKPNDEMLLRSPLIGVLKVTSNRAKGSNYRDTISSSKAAYEAFISRF